MIAALLPEGRGRLDAVGAMVRHAIPSGWARHRGLRVTAVDYDAGERVGITARESGREFGAEVRH